ncbi:MAG: AlpA family phage regulatory protein [Thiomicrospira sp.]|jgi:prophage regulatory protein
MQTQTPSLVAVNTPTLPTPTPTPPPTQLPSGAHTPTLPTPTQKIRRRSQVLAHFSISASTLYRWIERDGFPRPIQLGGHSVGWVETEIQAWLSNRPRMGASSA